MLDRATEAARSARGSGGPPQDTVGALLRAYYRHVAPEDLLDRGEVDLWGALVSHYRLAQERPQGTARVRVLTPAVDEQGWSAGGHSVVEVVTDDMPFLVDSVTMELTRQHCDVQVVVHPQFEVVRDVAGALRSVGVVDETTAEAEPGVTRESWMHVEVARLADDPDGATTQAIVDGLQRVLRDVRESVEDWDKMQARVAEITEELRTSPPDLPDEEVRQGRELLSWLAEDHFTFLGYREYTLADQEPDGSEVLCAVPGSGLGILRADPDLSADPGRLPAPVAAKARERTLLVLAKANSRATVHRSAYLDYVGVKTFDEHGEVTGERRFLGLFSSAAYTESLTRIPLLREKAAEVLRRAGFDPRSHAGKALLDTLENYPRDELFHAPVDELAEVAEAVMYTRERRQLRLFVRRDTYGRYLSCLVYLPRDRYNTGVRERMTAILEQRLGGGTVEFNARITESTLARVHFTVRPPQGELVADVDTEDLERRLADASRSWRDDFLAAVVDEYGEATGTRWGRAYADSFPEAYKEDFSARTAAVDVGRIDALALDPETGEGFDVALQERVDAGRGEARLKVYRVGPHLSLSGILPMLASLGVEVVDERPYGLEGMPHDTHVYEFGLRAGGELPPGARAGVQDAVRAMWDGRCEVDGFNRLVLAAGLTWRQASLLRAYAKYQKQGGTPFALDYIEEALVANVDLTRMLVQLFEARFDPGRDGLPADAEARVAKVEAVEERITRALDDVVSLDHDRILRSYLTLVRATVRTNWWQRTDDGEPKPYVAFKLEPAAVPELPEPRPRHEIFVYSPRVEGVHLRFGPVARGGLRWSDRRDDFRTEVLGLVKAQMVKNTVIVPVGAKGGFFAKQLPDTGDREAWMAEGVACYRTFISALLDVTDDLVDGETVPPRDVVRHDGDDAYLVVAADKGTATFSDIANELALSRGFWLGDAFASGGSVGYDHKAMGITARGAWVSVQRHFRERGIDCQAEDFTCVGIGDMSGDVFGNGMLCSEHTRLVAAFDHRHVFLDPDPDAATSYDERKRLYDLPRSSWADYDTSLISEGGGVFPRSAKSVPISPQVRRALGLADDVASLTPAELMRAVLLAPVDLLWNGGIGTYVKASTESHADAGDKANDAIRVDGRDLRAHCVGEGGNLGLTQRGRIEYALHGGPAGEGGRVNTDAIDNSAGVDTSDHEVNIKVLLDGEVAAGDLTRKQRGELLASMTDDVAALVLRDNYEQNLALANAAANAGPLLHVHEDWMKQLERRGVLNRELEALPPTREVRARLERGQGLTTPEHAVLMSWTKIVLADELLASDLPDDPYLRSDLFAYFPQRMHHAHRERMESHPLRREIVVTQAVNDLVNAAGTTFWPRLAGETGASAPELVRANFVAREIFGSLALREELASYDNRVDAAVQTHARLEMRTLVERATRWLVTHRRPPLDSEATVDFFGVAVQQAMAELPGLMGGREQRAYDARRAALVEQGLPEDLAGRVAVLPPAYTLLGVVETARADDVDPLEVARVHFALGERLGLPALLARVLTLPRADRWQTMARAALRDDVHAVHAQLTRHVLATTTSGEPAPARIADWEEADAVLVGRSVTTLEEITSDDTADLARMSVGLRVVRGLLAPG
nr:NAD-glutamate dehydrogenase [Nocardioides perillae]